MTEQTKTRHTPLGQIPVEWPVLCIRDVGRVNCYYLGRQYRLKVVEHGNQQMKLIGRYLRVFVADRKDKRKVAERVQL